jgi:MFS family permease
MSLAEAARPTTTRRATVPPSVSPIPRLRIRRARPRSDLAASVGDGAGVSAMVGLGETYFPAFALALGAGQTTAGLVATLPMLAGASLQLATPWLLPRIRSYKRWVVVFASLQASALLCIPVAAALTGRMSTAWIFFVASLYWAASQATGPAWNTWIEEVIPRRLRARFFARRTRICQTATLLGFALGGLALQRGQDAGQLLGAFVLVFSIGSLCRYLSAWFLSRHSEWSRGRYEFRHVPPSRLIHSSSRGGGALVLYLFAMQTAVQISGPYFAPFMLSQQKMTYVSYMILVALAYLGKVIALPLWGRVAHVAGARRLMSIGGIAIIPVAGLWLGADWVASWGFEAIVPLESLGISLPLSGVFLYLAGIQLISGFVWAGYELAQQLMFFEAIPRHERACMITYYNFGNAAAQVTGGLIGAAILQLGGESHGAYLAVFGISSLVRLCTLPLLARAVTPLASHFPVTEEVLNADSNRLMNRSVADGPERTMKVAA